MAYPCGTVTPGMNRASVRATWSKVLWSSLRTMTRHAPPRPVSGPAVRGSSTGWLTRPMLPLSTLAPIAIQPRPQCLGRHRLEVLLGGLRVGLGRDRLPHPGGEAGVIGLACALRHHAQALVERVELCAGIGEGPEVRRTQR